MKYVIIHKDEITQNILDEINTQSVTNPVIIWLVEPPENEPGGVDSNFRYIELSTEYPNLLKGYKKYTLDEKNAEILKIQAGIVISNKTPSNQHLDQDPTGRPIFRTAATIKGWHYQAHSVEFEVNKLGSIYNKDSDGNDLGYSELKIYDANNNECTTQLSADTNGVKTVVTWKPDFDFEIISGNVRQATKESINSYVYVQLQKYTGLPAPNDFLKIPFVEGGINLKYIGADEPLKTDGRASKLINAGTNGDYFEVIINYDSDLITNENRHEMSLIFEIYKDPTT